MADVAERPLRRDELDLLRRGRNVIAAHTRQTRGGPGVDLQVQWIELIDRQSDDVWPPVRKPGR